jgi:phenolic acid decarboxylase
MRDVGPTCPIEVVNVFAEITLFEFMGGRDEKVISVGPWDVPNGFAVRIA